MTENELRTAVENAPLDSEVVELLSQHSADTECVLMGPMGQTDVMQLAEILAYATDHYDLWDYIELHVCTIEAYVQHPEGTRQQEREPVITKAWRDLTENEQAMLAQVIIKRLNRHCSVAYMIRLLNLAQPNFEFSESTFRIVDESHEMCMLIFSQYLR